MIDAQIDSTVLNASLAYKVYTPPCYQAYPQQHYPVLYLLHGYGFLDDQWVRLGVIELADHLIAAGEIQPIIIVLPQESDQLGQPPQEQFSRPTWNYFGEALAQELVPAVDAKFRTIPQRQSRAIGGLSRGGNWAFHLGLTQWSLFSVVAGHSASLFMVDTPAVVEDWLAAIPPDQFPTFYIDSGGSDLGFDNILHFEAILDAYNVPHELHIYPGSHDEDYWVVHLEQYLRWYANNLASP
jgi:enterochelin esterase-like enzyme